ncbi:MAG: DUF4097 family beta strand repeat-containing protein [Phycisphaerae bacterium]|nr:DUF4097 family beta strand repeat-containing protein [Phycisphaerae bacterium]
MRTGALVRIAVATGLAAVTLGGCVIHTGTYKAKFSRSEDLTAPLANVTALDVATNVGTIRLEAGQVAEVRIAAEIKVRAATEEQAQELAEEVRIVAEPSGQTLTIKAIRPSDLGRNQLSVDFTITAPADLALDCTTNVGDIRVTGFTKRVKASADVGTIACTGLREEIDLRSNVGDLRAEYAGDAPAALNATMATNVGNIEFTGPQEISADLSARANVGSIKTDRPITVTGSLKHSISASLGKGEGRVSLNTNVGSIRIR